MESMPKTVTEWVDRVKAFSAEGPKSETEGARIVGGMISLQTTDSNAYNNILKELIATNDSKYDGVARAIDTTVGAVSKAVAYSAARHPVFDEAKSKRTLGKNLMEMTPMPAASHLNKSDSMAASHPNKPDSLAAVLGQKTVVASKVTRADVEAQKSFYLGMQEVYFDASKKYQEKVKTAREEMFVERAKADQVYASAEQVHAKDQQIDPQKADKELQKAVKKRKDAYATALTHYNDRVKNEMKTMKTAYEKYKKALATYEEMVLKYGGTGDSMASSQLNDEVFNQLLSDVDEFRADVKEAEGFAESFFAELENSPPPKVGEFSPQIPELSPKLEDVQIFF
jgi:tetratricopeptide (TPR) repeat protein